MARPVNLQYRTYSGTVGMSQSAPEADTLAAGQRRDDDQGILKKHFN
jgi:hypothetical protein